MRRVLIYDFSGDMVKRPVGSMSGGEKVRLVLCMIVWQRPYSLLLDESANHLDLAAREDDYQVYLLEDAMRQREAASARRAA